MDYLVESGADIHGVDFKGFPPYFKLYSRGLTHVDEQIGLRMVAGYKVFTSHRDWIPSRPRTQIPYQDFKVTGDDGPPGGNSPFGIKRDVAAMERFVSRRPH